MSRIPSVVSTIMVVQQLEPVYWLDFENDFIEQVAESGECDNLVDELIKKLNQREIKVTEAYGIVHDKDKQVIWDEEHLREVQSDKATHVHILLKFDKSYTLTALALALGVEPQYLEKTKSGRYGYDNVLAYLVHAKDPDKYQYKPEEVYSPTSLCEPYVSIYNRRMESWQRGRATKEAKSTNESVDYLVDLILKQKVDKGQVMLTNEYYQIYGQHKRRLNEAFETVGELKGYKAIEAIESKEFEKTVLFITALSGKGKTYLSKKLSKRIKEAAYEYEKIIWDHVLTASTNAFDEYCSEEILILDDLRGNALDVSDWLKLLDPHTISPISARYKNKIGAAKVIVITSTKSPKDFFENSRNNKDEDTGQFLRRLDFEVVIKDEYQVSIPVKNENLTDERKQLPTYKLEKEGDYSEEELIKLVLEKIIINNRWNKEESDNGPR